ncbi:MAG: exosortase-associated EpsI family protein [Phycisphaerae bacterium]|nr:exosortase-associated EpsI family protein [Phycisphaerae bacterium]
MTSLSRTNQHLILAGITAVAILGAGLLSLEWAQAKMGMVLQKTPTPLQAPLPSLPLTLGVFKVPPGSADERLSAETLAVLGTHDYLIRKYEDTAMPPDSPASVVQINLNYYPTDFATPHVPNVCWVGAGLQRVKDDLITIKNVPHADGKLTDMPMRFLAFAKPNGAGSGMPLMFSHQSGGEYINTAYTFQVDGKYAPNTQQVSAMFWHARSKYGYDCKIEVDVLGPSTRAEARKTISAFIRAALPSIERILPNWKKLNAPSARGAAAMNKTVPPS